MLNDDENMLQNTFEYEKINFYNHIKFYVSTFNRCIKSNSIFMPEFYLMLAKKYIQVFEFQIRVQLYQN